MSRQSSRKLQSAISQLIEQLETRRLLDGTDLDSGFSGDGKLLINAGTEEAVNAMLVQADGKLIAAGTSKLPTKTATILRYNTNGSPDASFSGDGKATLSFGSTDVTVGSVELAAGGKVLLGGALVSGQYFVARFNSNGTLDTSFGGGDGIATGAGSAIEMAQQGTNIIIIGDGTTIRRLSSNGTLDTTFGSGGAVNVGTLGDVSGFDVNDLTVQRRQDPGHR